MNFDVNLKSPYQYLASINNFKAGDPPDLEVEWESKFFNNVEFWPVEGDKVWGMGRWIFDCGHYPYRTEIHPPHAVAVMRTEPSILPGNNLPSDTVKTYFFLSGKGGYYNTKVAGKSYEFDIELPPKPSSWAKLRTQVLSLSDSLPTPLLKPIPPENPTKVHVEFSLKTISFSAEKDRYTSIIVAGWDEGRDISKSYTEFQVTMDNLKRY